MFFNIIRVLFTAILSLVLWADCFVCVASAAEKRSEPLRMTILYMNDPHAHYAAERIDGGQGLTGGFAKAQTLIGQIRTANLKEGRHTLFLLGGDLLTGTAFSTVFKGAMGVELLNNMELTAMVVGNHEFDYGAENLLKGMKPKAKFPLLSANIKDENGGAVFDSFIVKPLKQDNYSIPIVIMGLTTADTPSISTPKNIGAMRFSSPFRAAEEILADISDDSLVIALTHLGFSVDKELALGFPRINVIIGGHSHTRVEKPLRLGETLICQAGAYSELLGRLDIDFMHGKIISYSGSLIRLGPDVDEDPAIARLIEEYKTRMSPEFERTLCVSDVTLEVSRSEVRSDAPNLLARMIARLMAESASADLALINGGAIRSGFRKGSITLNHIYAALPFDDKVVKMSLKGTDIESVLRKSLEAPMGSGGKLQSFGIDHKITSGGIEISSINGSPFDSSRVYTLAIGEFLASGGDGYSIFGDKGYNRIETGILIRDLLVNYLEGLKTITEKNIESLNVEPRN